MKVVLTQVGLWTDQSFGLKIVNETIELRRGEVRVDWAVECTDFAHLAEGFHQVLIGAEHGISQDHEA